MKAAVEPSVYHVCLQLVLGIGPRKGGVTGIPGFLYLSDSSCSGFRSYCYCYRWTSSVLAVFELLLTRTLFPLLTFSVICVAPSYKLCFKCSSKS